MKFMVDYKISKIYDILQKF